MMVVSPQLEMPQLLLDARLAAHVLFRPDEAIQMSVRRQQSLCQDVSAEKAGRACQQDGSAVGFGLVCHPPCRSNARRQFRLAPKECHALLAPLQVAVVHPCAAVAMTALRAPVLLDQGRKLTQA